MHYKGHKGNGNGNGDDGEHIYESIHPIHPMAPPDPGTAARHTTAVKWRNLELQTGAHNQRRSTFHESNESNEGAVENHKPNSQQQNL